MCGVDFLNSQEGNKLSSRYLSGKRMQMQTKLFNKYVLFFFFLSGFPLHSFARKVPRRELVSFLTIEEVHTIRMASN